MNVPTRTLTGRHGPAGRRRLRDPEEGQIMLLTLAFTSLVIALVLIVASASAVHIERKRLLALADAVAADAADAVDVTTYYGSGQEAETGGPTLLPLSDASVEAAVREYLARAPGPVTGEFAELRVVEPTGTPDGTVAEITLAATARPPLVPWVLLPWSDGIALRVTSTARAG